MNEDNVARILSAPYLDAPQTRSVFLRRAAGAGILAALGTPLIGCGASTSSSQKAAGSSGKVGGDLTFLTWEGYPLEKETATWRAARGVSEHATYIGTQDDVQTKLLSPSAPAVDLSTYNQGYADLYRSLDIMRPLDAAKIPNYNSDDIYPEFYRAHWWEAQAKLWAVPFTWGSYSLLYNPKFVQRPSSWNDLLDPALKGRVAMMDDPLATWPAAAIIGGYGRQFPNVTHAQLADIMKKLGRFKAQTRSIVASYGDLTNQMVAGEVVATFSVWAAVTMWSGQQNVEIRSTVPREGASSWTDAWFVPKTAKDEATALAFINEAFSPQTQASAAENLAGGVVNRRAVPLLNKATASLYPYDEIAAHLKAAPLYGIPPRTSKEFATFDDWLAAWQAFKV